MAKMYTSEAAMVVMLGVLLGGTVAIPSRVANRMIPSWWLTARTQKSCVSWSDCNVDECCARPMLSSNSYCLPFKSEGETCDASAMLLDIHNEVFFDHCPCETHLTCAKMHSQTVCVDPASLSRMTPRPSPQPLPIKL
ncbi:prokineticin Bm8-d-like [Penaeus monodon]|uniref:prokineticin Bm8-d-like n=1 Tax=Penaeus monodon TaxID=6687 RepID=UPI0018A7342D|nr:prokineticin Bm8-d-like [Penaeus monodon]